MGNFDNQLETLINKWLDLGDDPNSMADAMREAIKQLTRGD